MPRRGIYKRRSRLRLHQPVNADIQRDFEYIHNILRSRLKNTNLANNLTAGYQGDAEAIKKSSAQVAEAYAGYKNSGFSVPTIISLLKLLV